MSVQRGECVTQRWGVEEGGSVTEVCLCEGAQLSYLLHANWSCPLHPPPLPGEWMGSSLGRHSSFFPFTHFSLHSLNYSSFESELVTPLFFSPSRCIKHGQSAVVYYWRGKCPQRVAVMVFPLSSPSSTPWMTSVLRPSAGPLQVRLKPIY